MSDKIESNFFKTPNNIYTLDLKHNQLLVLLFLLSWKGKEKTCYFGCQHIANQCNISLSQVKRALSYLRKQRLITVDSGKNRRRTNRYQVNAAAIMERCILTPDENKLREMEQEKDIAKIVLSRKEKELNQFTAGLKNSCDENNDQTNSH